MFSDVYYVVFREAERKRWYLKLLKKNFSHCFVLTNDKGNWVKYESGDGIARVDIVSNYADHTNDCIIVRIETEKQKRTMMLNSCVGFAKFIIGCGGLSLTPYQLYKRIK